MKKALSWSFIVLSVVLLFFLTLNSLNSNKTIQKAQDGVLDLTHLSEAKQIVALSGEWKFTPNQFVDPHQFHKEAANQQVPKGWDSDAQYGTYQLKIKLPPHYKKLGLRLRIVWSAHKIFVNGQQIAQQGTIGTTKETTIPNNPAYEVYFTPNTSTIVLTMQVANFYNARSGIVFPIDLGMEEAMKDAVIQDINIETAGIFLFLIFTIFHFSLYLLRKVDKAFFYSGCYFLTFAFLVLTRGERVLLRSFPQIPFDFYFRLQDFMTFINAVMLYFFLFYTTKNLMSRRMLYSLSIPLIVYSLFIVCFPGRTWSMLQSVFFVYINIIVVIVIGKFVYSYMKKEYTIPKNELVILIFINITLLLVAASGSIDQLHFSGLNMLNRLSFLAFIIGMNVFLVMRLVNRTVDAENFSTRLEKATISKDAFVEVTTKELEQPIVHALNVVKSLHIQQRMAEHSFLEKQLERLLYLVNDLKDFTRIRFQDFHIEIEPVNLYMVVQYVLSMHEKAIQKSNIKLDIQIASFVEVYANEQKLKQILYRAVDTMIIQAANGTMSIQITQHNSEVQLVMEGKGQHKITPTITDETGQSIGQTIMEQMGGQYDVAYVTNCIRFRITMRLYQPIVGQLIEIMTTVQADLTSATEDLPKLFIVDDDVMHAEAMQSLLQTKYAVQVAHSAEEALQLMHIVKPDFMLIDEMMPKVDGLTLTKQIRANYRYIELPIIMLVNDEHPTNIELVLQSGANDYIRKPVLKETLVARLSAIEVTKIAMKKAVEKELAFLQVQIKPHFLYNALSSIIYLCYTDGEKAGHLLSMLSTYLRYVFESSKEGYHATLRQELDIIQAYVEIEQVRFDGRLFFDCDVDETIQTDDIIVPSLLIQPLVENAIRHGIFEKEGDGRVTLRIQKQDELLIVQVIDDGIGMGVAQQQKLLQQRATVEDGIGFSNVLHRVNKMDGAILAIQSEVGEGTTIMLTIPERIR